MDFDPSEFLAVALSEDQDAVYTAPDIQDPCPIVDPLQDLITVEGGLQMEKEVQISVPTFNTLDFENTPMEDVEEENSNPELPFNGDVFSSSSSNENELETVTTGISKPLEQITSSAQLSPVESTASPHLGKKIPSSYDEQRFRKDFFCGYYDRVKLFRLHCTICDKHLGCAPWFTERQMRMHKLLRVSVCRKCFDFYGNVNFPVEDGSEVYCCWCGEGGELFCCSKCPKAICKKCLARNFGPDKVKEVEDNDNWSCVVCNPVDIWPHRLIMWGLQRLAKEMRQNVSLRSKEEKQAVLSKDTAHCCPKINEECSSISLPPKRILSRIPISLIAVTHQMAVRNQPEKTKPTIPAISKPRVTPFVPVSTVTPFANMNGSQQRLFQPVLHGGLPNQQHLRMMLEKRNQSTNPGMNHAYSAKMLVGRSPQTVRPGKVYTPIQTKSKLKSVQTPAVNSSSQPPEIIDLVEESKAQQQSKSSTSNYDISWLERGIKKVNESLLPVNRLTGQLTSISDDLKNDLSAIDSYFDKLSFALKMAICNLAKVNQEMIEDKKRAFDNTVSSVVNEIQKSGVFSSMLDSQQTPNSSVTPSNPVLSVSIPPPVLKEPQGAVESIPTTKPETAAPSSGDDEAVDVNLAVFCEAVLEVDGNKENNNGNKVAKAPENVTPSKSSNITSRKRPRGKPKSPKNISKSTSDISNNIQVINLVDDSDDTGHPGCVAKKSRNMSDLCKKFNIKPCRIILRRCKLEYTGF